MGAANSATGLGLAAAILGVRGPTYTYSSTCASGVVAVGHALRELEHGDIDIALAGGHDAALLPPVYQMYRDAGLLSLEQEDPRRAIRPYGGNSRNALGEAAVTVALESREHADARGAEALATLVGYRYGNSGLHPTNIEATGDRAAELIESLLARHGVSPEQVGFVVGHGNGVEGSDRAELAYMRRVFGDRAPQVPLVTVKPIYGHTLGASGVVSLAAAALMLKNQFIVPTINMDPQNDTGVAHQPNVGAPRACETGLVVCFGISGQNGVLLLRRAA